MSKTILYLNTDVDAVNAEMLMPRFPRAPLHVHELKFNPGRNFIPDWNYFRLHEHFNQRWEQEYFNPGWTQKHQKNMQKVIFVLSSALTTCLLLFQCYSILTLKIMQVRSQLSISRWKQCYWETTPLLDSKEWNPVKLWLCLLINISNT